MKKTFNSIVADEFVWKIDKAVNCIGIVDIECIISTIKDDYDYAIENGWPDQRGVIKGQINSMLIQNHEYNMFVLRKNN